MPTPSQRDPDETREKPTGFQVFSADDLDLPTPGASTGSCSA